MLLTIGNPGGHPFGTGVLFAVDCLRVVLVLSSIVLGALFTRLLVINWHKADFSGDAPVNWLRSVRLSNVIFVVGMLGCQIIFAGTEYGQIGHQVTWRVFFTTTVEVLFAVGLYIRLGWMRRGR